MLKFVFENGLVFIVDNESLLHHDTADFFCLHIGMALQKQFAFKKLNSEMHPTIFIPRSAKRLVHTDCCLAPDFSVKIAKTALHPFSSFIYVKKISI